LTDLQSTVDLIAATCMSFDADEEFTMGI